MVHRRPTYHPTAKCYTSRLHRNGNARPHGLASAIQREVQREVGYLRVVVGRRVLIVPIGLKIVDRGGLSDAKAHHQDNAGLTQGVHALRRSDTRKLWKKNIQDDGCLHHVMLLPQRSRLQ